MSREIGGRADKDGNDFERLWVVHQALRVLLGELTSLHWERVGEVGFGIELELTFPNGRREVHQCKIENGTKGKWSAADLAAADVLAAAFRQLQRPGVDEFVFVSRDPVPLLRDLAERSHRANGDPELFFQASLSSNGHRSEFAGLCTAWGLEACNAADRARAFSLLQHLRFEIGIWDSHRTLLESHVSLIAEGGGREIVASLGNFLLGKLGNEVYADDLRAHLRGAGHAPRDLRADPRVASGVERLQRSFEDSLKGMLLGGSLLPRTETQDLLRLLDDPTGPRVVFLHGPAGIGKSDVQLELVQALAERRTPLLPIRLDSRRPAGSVTTFSRDVLELPAEPAQCLAVLAGDRTAVLLIDQLDALRWTGGHSAEALRICKEIIEAALAVEAIRVVLACRTFDLENDPSFKAWEREYAGRSPHFAQRVEVKLLAEDQTKAFVEAQGARYGDLRASQRELLRHPYTLFLWWDLYRERRESPQFVTKTDLLAEYCKRIRQRLVEMGQPEAWTLLDELVGYLDERGRLDAPDLLARSQHRALEALQSMNVLRAPRNGVVTFAHQSLLDFLIAERVAREALAHGTSPVDWLRRRDQSLFRRDQLRQLLVLLRDRDRPLYIATLHEILSANDIRFHLQHLALGMLREASEPTKEELELVERLLAEAEWRAHVLDQVVFGKQGWFEALDDAGLLARWLGSGDEQLIEDALQVCRSAAPKVPDRLERLLAPYWDTGDERWRERVDSALGYQAQHFTDRMFEWRLARVRTGARRIDWFDLDELAGQHPTRALALLEAHLLRMLEHFETSGQLTFDWRERAKGAFEKACKAAPEGTWARLLPILFMSIRLYRALRPSPSEREQWWRHLDSPRRELRKLNFQVQRLLSVAGSELAHREGLAAVDYIAPLLPLRSKSVQRVVLFMLLESPDELADFAVQWLYADLRRLQLGSFHDASYVEPARRLIERFAGICSDAIYQELEASLLDPPDANERIQHILLSALPRSRMSSPALANLETWDQEFGKPPTGRRRGGAGPVSSPIPREELHTVSDERWLSIIATDWKETRTSVREVKPGHFVEESHEQFAQDFGQVARLFPERFVHLGLLVPPASPRGYFRALLNAFADKPPTAEQGAPADWAPASVEAIEALLKHIGSLQERDTAWAVCRLIEARAEDAWSEWAINLVCGYAEHPDPEPQYFSVRSRVGEGEERVDVSDSALNCVRGSAAGTLMHLLFAKPELRQTCLPTVRRLIDDPHPAVRVAAQGLCLPLYNSDRELAVELFVRSCDHADDRVLAGLHTDHFLRYTWHRYPEKLTLLFERMVQSSQEGVAEKGAFWVTVGRIGEGLWSELGSRCLEGTTPQRRGTAKALSRLFQSEWRQAVLPDLLNLFDDQDETVSSEVVDLLREKEVLESLEGPRLADAFVRSDAFERDPSDLFFGLEHHSGSLVPYAKTILAAVERLGGTLAPATRNVSTRPSGAAHYLPSILLRLYEQTEGESLKEVRTTCLDAWDSLLRGRIGTSWDVLRKIDA